MKRMAIAAAFAALSFVGWGATLTAVSTNVTSTTLSIDANGVLASTSATVLFEYGFAADALSLSAEAEVSFDANGVGTYELLRLTPDSTYFVCAKFTPAGGDQITTDVISAKTLPLDERLLPAGYQQVEYVESDDRQYVDTGVIGRSGVSAHAKMMWIKKNANDAFLGSRKGTIRCYLLLYYNGWCLGYDSHYDSGGSPSTGTLYETSSGLEAGKQYLSVNNGQNVISKAYANSMDTGLSMYIFALNENGSATTTYLGSTRCYELQIWEQGVLARDYVPCYSAADKAYGLWDFAKGGFSKSGTATGLLGPELVATDRALNVASTDDESATLAISANATEESTLYRVDGQTYGGKDVAAWGAVTTIGTIGASDVIVTNTAPFSADWGKEVYLSRFFLVTGTTTNWSETVIAPDKSMPAFTVSSVDGTGGDTIKITGEITYIPGNDCVISAYRGDSADALTTVYSNLLTTNDTGTFEVTLFSPDKADGKYVVPGSSYYVALEIVSNGKTLRSLVTPVNTKEGNKIDSSSLSSSVIRRELTFTSALSEVGAGGKATVTLFTGESNDPATFVQAENPIEVTDTSSFSISHTFDTFEKTYYGCFRVVNEAEGGTVAWTNWTAVTYKTTQDTTTYTWTGAGADNSWTNSANWSDNKDGDCLGYPQSVNATVYFKKDARVNLDLPLKADGGENMGSFYINQAGIDVTFYSDDPNAYGLVLKSFTTTTGNSRWTLDHAYVNRAASWTWASGTTLVLTNGAHFAMSGSTVAGTVIISADSLFEATTSTTINGGGQIVVNDATYKNGGNLEFKTGASSLRFEGTHPKWLQTSQAGLVYASAAGADPHIEFVVPEGGFESAPFDTTFALMSVKMGNKNASTAGSHTIAIDISDDSPAAKIFGEVTTPLVAWPGTVGINTTVVAGGNLPNEVEGSAFDWNPAAQPEAIGVKLVGCAENFGSAFVIEGAPVAAPGVTPDYGARYDLADGESVPCSAPARAAASDGAYDAVCTGYVLYKNTTGLATGWTEVTRGPETSYTYTHTAGTAGKLVWQWTEKGHDVPHERTMLPSDGYQMIEYIECDGKEFIDTGVYPDSTIRVKMKFSSTETTNYKYIFGVRKSGWNAGVYLSKAAPYNLTCSLGTGENNVVLTTGIGSDAPAEIDFSIGGISVDSRLFRSAGELAGYDGDGVSTQSMLLFANRTTENSSEVDAANAFRGNCYGCQIWSGGVLVRDYVPCCEVGGERRVGLYDLVAGEFVLPDCGTFTPGTDVTPPTAHRFVVRGLPDEAVKVRPAFGTYEGVTDGASFFCTADSPFEVGDATYTISGYVVTTNATDGSGAKIVVASGTESEFAYVQPAADAELTWTWQVAAPLGVGTAVASDTNVSAVTLSTVVTGLGDGTSGGVRFVYGTHANALNMQTAPIEVTNAGEVRMRLQRLQPSTTYYVKAVVTNNLAESAESAEIVSFTTHTAQEIERLLSVSTTGEQVFYSDFKIGQWTRLEVDFAELGSGNYPRVFSAECLITGYFLSTFRPTSTSGSYAYQRTSNSKEKDTYSALGVSNVAGTRYRFVYDMQNARVKMENVDTGALLCDKEMSGTYNGETTRNCVCFGGRLLADLAGAQPTIAQCDYRMKGAFYGIRVYEAGVLVRDYVPVRLTATNEIGLYDQVTGRMMAVIGNAEGLVPDASCGRAFESVESVGMSANLSFAQSLQSSELYRVCDIEDRGIFSAADWMRCERIGEISMDDTEATVGHPEDWGEAVAVERFFFVTGGVTNFSPAVCWKSLSNPLDIGTPAVSASTFGTATVQVSTEGLGTTASEATFKIVFSDDTNDLNRVTASQTLTLPQQMSFTANGLAAGKTYYFKAVGDNDQHEHIESDVVEFTMPDIPEPGVYTSASYAQSAHLVAYWDALDNMGANKRDDTSLVWRDLSGNGYDWTLANGTYNWTDRGLRLNKKGIVGTLAQEDSVFEGKVSTVEFVYANAQTNASVILSMGLGGSYLYTDGNGPIGFYGPSAEATVGTAVNVNETNCYSVVYTRGLGVARPTGVDNFRVNGESRARVTTTSYFTAGTTTPTLGGRVYNSGAAPANGEIFAIRIYDVVLTDEEREQNRATDEMRFIRGVEPVALRQRNGRVEMTLPVSAASRTVVLWSDETYRGTNGWTTASDPVTVDPGQTDVSFSLPQGWGATKFFARAEITEGDLTLWSQTLVWKDPNVPAVTLGELDGLGGDTIIVKGSVDSLGGESCTLKVYTGTSEDEIIDEWTGFDTVTVEDDFELTLSAGDPSAADCLKPGETYFVKVVATGSSGKTATSIVKSVTTASTAAFLSQSSTIKSLRWMKVTAAMSDLGMTGKTEVQLWVGEDADHLACVTNIQYVTEVAKNFILEYELPEFEKEYVWQLRAVNVSAGGTTNVTASYDMSTQTALDKAIYTWTGAGADNRWTNPTNWADNTGGDSRGYPQSVNATASFTTDARVNVDLPKTATIILRFDWADKPTDVTFTSVNTNDYGLTLGSIYVPTKAGSRLTLDHVAMSRDTSFKWNAGTTLVLTNGANYRQWGINLNDGFTLVIDNSTLTTAGAVTLNYDGGSDTRVLFKGAAPKWVEASSFKNAGGSVALDFLVPVDGWESAPIDAPNSGSVMLTGGSSCTFNVCVDSPAARVDETITTPLVNWSTGIDKGLAAEGTLPNELSQDAFVWDDPNSPKVLSAKIVGSTHKDRLTVAGEPELVLGDRITPEYGHIDGNNETTPVELTAPNGAIEFVTNRRATCAGWKLYDMDPATQEPILPAAESGTGRSYTWTNKDKWQRFAWQWAIENKVSVTAALGVTVPENDRWVLQGGSVAIPVTCEPHVCISAVEGGAFVDGAIVVSGVTGPVTVTLTTGNAWYVATDGNDDDNDGTTPTTAFATVAKALEQAAPGDEVRVGAGVFAPAATVVSKAGVTIVGVGVGKTVFNGEGVNAVGFSVVAGATVKGISVVGYPKGGVTMTGGLVEGCALVSNGLYGATLSGGTLRNSLVYGTVATTKAQAGVAISGGEVINCTLADNTNTTDIAYSDLLQSGGTVKNTIARFATVTKGTEDHNCFNEPVAFRGNSKTRKYALAAEAKNCIDKGDDSVWDGVVCPRDLAGRDRIFLKGKRRSAAVDIGCYEFSPAGTVIIVR